MAGSLNIDILKKDYSSQKLSNVLTSFGLKLVISMPKRITETTETCILTILLLTLKLICLQSNNHPSEHHAIVASIKINNQLNKN